MVSYQEPPEWLFQSNWLPYINLALFGLTGGYITTICSAKACLEVESGIAIDLVGGYIGIAITLGTLIGLGL